MSDTSENSSIIPQWAETTFDKLRRGTMRNLEPPKLNFSSIFFDASDSSTSIKNGSNSTTNPKSLIAAPLLKPPKRVYKNNAKKINKSPKATKEGRVTKNRKKTLKSKRSVKPVKDVSREKNEKSTLPEDNVLLHELITTQDRTKLSTEYSFPSITTPNFKSTLFTSTPVNIKSKFNNNHLPDLSAVEDLTTTKFDDKFNLKSQIVLTRNTNVQHLSSFENLSKSKLCDKFNLKSQICLTRNTNVQHLSSLKNLNKSKLDDKFNLKCQVVLPRTNINHHQDLSGVGDLSTSKSDNNSNSKIHEHLSSFENSSKPKLDDKFHLKCQVVLPRTNINHHQDLSGVGDLSTSKLDDNSNSKIHEHLSSFENLSKSKLDDKFHLKCQVVLSHINNDHYQDLSSKSDDNSKIVLTRTDNKHLQDLSGIENLFKSKLDDKFHLKCQVVLPCLEIDKISDLKTNLEHIQSHKSLIRCDTNNKSGKLPIVRLERLNIDKFLQKSRHENSLSLIESSFSRNSFKLRIKFKSTRDIFKSGKRGRKSKFEHLLCSRSFTVFKNLTNINYEKKRNITLDPQLLVLCTRLNQDQIDKLTNSKRNSTDHTFQNNSEILSTNAKLENLMLNNNTIQNDTKISTNSTLIEYSSSTNLTSASANEILSVHKSCELSSSSINLILNENSNKENSPIIDSNLNSHKVENNNKKSPTTSSNINHDKESVINSDDTNKEEFISIKKSLINKRRGGQLSDKIKRKIIQTDEFIDLTLCDSDNDLSKCEIIEVSSSEESIGSNKPIKNILKTPNNLHCKVLLRNFTNNITSSSTPNKTNQSPNITPFSTPNKSNRTLNTTPNQLNESNNSVNVNRNLEVSSTLPDKIHLKTGKHWRRSLSILRNTCAFKNPNDWNLMTVKKKGRKWRSTCFEIKNDNKSVCLNTFTPDSPQTKNIDAAELLTDSQSNLNESIPAKRISIRIVPAIIPTTRISQKDNFCRIGDDEHNTERSDLEIYARITQNFHRTGYVSKVDQNKIQELDDDFNDLSLDINNQSTVNESVLEPSLIRSSSFDVSEYSHCVTAQDIVLKRCNQTNPIDFDICYPDSVLQKCQKLGEGVYGEVFLLKNADGSATVLKIIPIEGPLPVNGEHQKKFDEIISEIIITQELSGLRDNALNCTECFTYVQNVRCVRGKYPTMLIDLWELYDEMKGSENEHPGIFDDDQLYIVFELEHGGRDLESFEFLNAEQAYSIFIQTALALSIAENELEFEHRDLHWGNLLIQSTKSKTIIFKLNGEEIEVNTCGVKATIIDFTLSRVTYNNVCIYNNLADDPDLFKSVGDYQFEIYKMMQKRNQNQWEHFEPYTNILWLHYIILKMIDGARYKRKKTPKHSKSIALMKDLSNELLTQQSSEQFVIQFYYQKPNEYTKAL